MTHEVPALSRMGLWQARGTERCWVTPEAWEQLPGQPVRLPALLPQAVPGGHLGEEAGHTQPKENGRMSVGGPQRSEYQGREHSEAVEDEKAEATIAR